MDVKTSVEPLRRTKYSYVWAESVLHQFFNKYPRVQYFFNNFLGLSDETMTHVIAERPEEWRFLKAAAKLYGDWANKQLSLFPGEPVPDEKALCKNAVRFVKRVKGSVNCPQSLESYIDKRLKLN